MYKRCFSSGFCSIPLVHCVRPVTVPCGQSRSRSSGAARKYEHRRVHAYNMLPLLSELVTLLCRNIRDVSVTANTVTTGFLANISLSPRYPAVIFWTVILRELARLIGILSIVIIKRLRCTINGNRDSLT